MKPSLRIDISAVSFPLYVLYQNRIRFAREPLCLLTISDINQNCFVKE
ncbi:MAG: hypothetical protein ACLRX7_06650 [Acutalibacteraceae bacterium]